MTREEYQALMEDMIYLVFCAVNEIIPDKKRVESANLPILYKAAESHLLTAAVAFALDSAGIHDSAFIQAKAKAIRKIALMDADMAVIFAKMDKAGIWYMPLKGTVLKDYYPKFGMREMSDHDILFDASHANEVKQIMIGMGYDAEHFGSGNHDCYYKEPVSNFEMHRSLFGIMHETKLHEYYSDVKTRLLPDEGSTCGYHFSPEDFYIYMIAHEYKHYSNGGTGLRSLLDTYVYLNKVTIDMDYVAAETEKLGIREFEELNRSLSVHLFADGMTLESLPEKERDMLSFVQKSGTYGTLEHSIKNKMKKVVGKSGKVTAGMKMKYYLSRLFPRQEVLSSWYPPAKFKVLVPFVWLYRILVVAVVRRDKVRGEIRLVEKQKNL